MDEGRSPWFAALQMVRRMALYGPGPDTTSEQTLATIVAYIDKKIASPCDECVELGCATNGEPCSCECRHGDHERALRDAEERLRELIGLYVPAGFGDEDGVWHDGPHRANGLRALDALVAELGRAREAFDEMNHDHGLGRCVPARAANSQAQPDK